MKRRHKKNSRGFALLVVLVLVSLLAATVMLALREATSSLAETGRAKSSEIVYADLNRGLWDALRLIDGTDPMSLIDPSIQNDIFKSPPDPTPFTTLGPAAGAPYAVRVRVGLRPGQRTQPPPGEDARTSYGYVVEVQLQADVDTTANAGLAPAQDRVSVGVRVPGVISHSN